MPKVYIIDDQVPNAFATGRNPEHAAIAVTTALMNYLSPKEIEGVLAHEMTHVRNHDILIGTVAAALAGIISTVSRFAMWFGGSRDRENSNPIAGLLILILAPIAAMIIQLAVSRSREYKADEGGWRALRQSQSFSGRSGKDQFLRFPQNHDQRDGSDRPYVYYQSFQQSGYEESVQHPSVHGGKGGSFAEAGFGNACPG